MPAPQPAASLISTQSELEGACRDFDTCDCIAVDTEFNRTNTYKPQLCVVQLAADSRLALLDMLPEQDFTALERLLATNPSLKLFHAAKQDFEALLLSCEFLPNRVLDTQIAAGFLGYPAQIGYARLVQEVLGIELDKGETRTDWSRRPLSDRQLHYAAADVSHLFALYEVLKTRLEQAGRYEWAMEDSARLLDPALYRVDPDEAWQRLPGLAYQPVEVQARGRALAAWREARALRIDRPRQWVLGDKLLLAIAQANPAETQALGDIPDLPPAIARRQGDQILSSLAEANRALAAGELELERKSRSDAPDPAAVKALGAVLREQAEHMGMAPEILATRRELLGLLRGELEQPVLSGWRREAVGERLLAALP
jgi:ribonuclease D